MPYPDSQICALAFNADGSRCLIGYKRTGGRRAFIRLVHFEGGEFDGIRPVVSNRVSVLAVPDEGKRPLVGTTARAARFVSTWRDSRSPDYSRARSEVRALAIDLRDRRTLSGSMDDRTIALAFGDGTRLVSGSDDTTIVLWDTTRWDPILTLTGHKGSVRSLDFSPDGSKLVSGSEDRRVRIWDAGQRTKQGF